MNNNFISLHSTVAPSLEQINLEFESLIVREVKNSNFSISSISTETGVHRNTLTKMKEGQTSAVRNLASFKKYKIFSFFYSSRDLAEKFPHFNRLFDAPNETPKWDPELSTSDKFSEIITQELSDPTSIAIFALALESGFDEIALKDKYGKHGIEIANRLIEKKLMFYSNKKYYTITTNYVDIQKNGLKNIIVSLAKNYNPSNSGQGKNYINFRLSKVNPFALSKLQQLHAEFALRVSNLLEKQDSKGSIPFYSINQMDVFGNGDN